MNNPFIASLSNDELIAATRDLARRSCDVEADLLVHLGEIDERRLYLDRAFSSMFAFCTRDLGFSEGAAYNLILVARAARKLPAIIDAARSGRVHLAGLRLLAPHLTEDNHADLLRRAMGRTKEEIFRAALKLLVEDVKKERFGVGRNARTKARGVVETDSRHVPDAMKRAVYERDGGRCAFVDSRGKRCEETGALEIDHVDGFARTHRHDVDELRLLCRAHNQHAAETMYGRAFMDAARQETRPGTC